MMPDQIDFKAKCKSLEDRLQQVNRERSKLSPGKLDEFMASSSQQDKIKSLQSLSEDLKTKVSLLKKKNYDLETDLVRQKQDHEKELAALRLEFQEHRERSLTLLTEKDDEIDKLRNLMRVDRQRQDTSDSECSICMENMRPGAPNVMTLPCSHRFHKNCINVSNHCNIIWVC